MCQQISRCLLNAYSDVGNIIDRQSCSSQGHYILVERDTQVIEPILIEHLLCA